MKLKRFFGKVSCATNVFPFIYDEVQEKNIFSKKYNVLQQRNQINISQHLILDSNLEMLLVNDS